MIRSIRAVARACRGNAAIEFALVLPAFLGIVFGTIEYGRLLWMWQGLQEVAQAGARCMAIRETSCASGGSYSSSSTTTYVENTAADWGITLSGSNITLNNSATCGGTSGFSEVSLSTTFTSVVPTIVKLPGAGSTLAASACYPNVP
jgi:Flp pilus assembly protein TadG